MLIGVEGISAVNVSMTSKPILYESAGIAGRGVVEGKLLP